MTSSPPTQSSSNLDQQLRRLAIAAQQQPTNSRERQKALVRLIAALQRSGKLAHLRRDQFYGFYDEIYAEALQRLFTYLCEKIDRYQPQQGEVLQWVNFLLDRQFFIEASREWLPVVYRGLDPRTVKFLTYEELDQNNPSEVNPDLVPLPSQQVLQCLEDDPEGIFQQTCVTNCPRANFQRLAMWRLMGYSWQEISAELAVPIPTLSSFYQRCLNKFAPKLKAYLT